MQRRQGNKTGISSLSEDQQLNHSPRTRLATRIALVAAVLAFGCLLIVSGISYALLQRQLINEQNIALRHQTHLYAQQISNAMQTIVGTMEKLATTTLLFNVLQDNRTRQTALNAFFDNFNNINDMPISLALVNTAGNLLAGDNTLPPRTEAWRQVLKTGKPYAVMQTGAESDYLLVVEPARRSRGSSPEAVLLYKITLDSILPSIHTYTPHPDATLRLIHAKTGEIASFTNSPRTSAFLSHTELLPVAAALQPLGLAIEVAVDRNTIATPLNRLLSLYIAIGVIVMFVVFGLAWIGAHYLTHPLRVLESVARLVIETGSLNHRFASYGVYEIEQLGRIFNQMLEQLNSLYHELYDQADRQIERNQALAATNQALEQEISDRQHAEAALRESEERLQLALEAANQGIFDIDFQTGEAIISPEYARMLGYEPESFRETKNTWLARLHPDDRARIIDILEHQLGGEINDYRTEFRLRTHIGGWIWVLSLGSVVRRNNRGQPLRLLGINADITQRKQAEFTLAKTIEELRLAEQRQRELLAITQREQGRLRALLGAMSIGILFEDSQQRVEYLNPAFLRLWAIEDETQTLVGRSTRTLLEHSTHRFARPDHASQFVLQVQDTHQISERCEIDLYDGRTLTQMSYPVTDNQDCLLGRLWLYEDITHERRTAQQLLYMAERDPLTGLANRHSFQKHLEQKIATALRENSQFAVIYFDLDEFKTINDTFGHRAGDTVLVRTAGEIGAHIRTTELFARLGGDEFAILSNLGPHHEPGALPSRIVNTISAIPFRFRGTNLRLTASVGIAFFPEHGDNVEQLVAHADTAMYQAKSQGKNTWAVYDPSRDSSEMMKQRLNWNSRIAEALKDQLFDLYFQGVYHTDNRALSHLEVLLRMRNPEKPDYPILPGQFIHLAEKSGQVLDIDRWVLKQSVSLLGRHPDLPPLAVNLSGRSFDDPTLPQFIRSLLTENAVAPPRLLLELTETAAVSDVQDAQRFIEAIQQVGCGVCLDDFGSGFSTFAYLKYLNVKVLKIDGLFIRDLPNNHDNQVFVRAMVEVARGLRKTTVAEFVEDAATFAMLRDLGVDLAQGYHFDRPSAEHPSMALC